MGGLFGGGSKSPAPPPPKAGDSIQRIDSKDLNTDPLSAQRAAVGAATETAKKTTTGLLGTDTEGTPMAGNSTGFG